MLSAPEHRDPAADAPIRRSLVDRRASLESTPFALQPAAPPSIYNQQTDFFGTPGGGERDPSPPRPWLLKARLQAQAGGAPAVLSPALLETLHRPRVATPPTHRRFRRRRR